MALSADARAEIFKALGSAAPAASDAAAPVISSPSPTAPLSKEEQKTAKKIARKAAKKAAKAAAAADPDAPPAPTRPPNAWILFSGRVEKVIREKEIATGVAKDAKMRTVVVKQFAAALKKEKAYDDWSATDILDALDSWTPPPKAIVAEPVAAAGASESDVEPVHTDDAAAAASKKRGPKKLADMTDDERAAHAAKLAERKAKKATAAADTSAPADA